jgi:hypothetical protein
MSGTSTILCPGCVDNWCDNNELDCFNCGTNLISGDSMPEPIDLSIFQRKALGILVGSGLSFDILGELFIRVLDEDYEIMILIRDCNFDELKNIILKEPRR